MVTTAPAVSKVVTVDGIYGLMASLEQYFSGNRNNGNTAALDSLGTIKTNLQMGDLEKAIEGAREIRGKLPLDIIDGATFDARNTSVRLLFDLSVYLSQIQPFVPYHP